jgi:copper oxidase (laccase) domain-containing protein
VDELLRREIAGRTVVVGATERSDGDVHPGRVAAADLCRRQRMLVGAPWVMLDQRHGADVYTVTAAPPPAWPLAGAADVLVAPADLSPPLAVWAADCAPVVLLGADGTRVAAHAGWRGLSAGAVEAALDAVGVVDAAVLGPCIHRCCYEFEERRLVEFAAAVALEPDQVTGRTTWGTSGLDVPAVVGALLERRGVALDVVGACTGCDVRFHSHRRRAEPARHAVVTWVEQAS